MMSENVLKRRERPTMNAFSLDGRPGINARAAF